ncbi:MAG TPA: hypothetical protein VFZ61_00865, partial [Polyangiales bacterium]
LARELAAGSSYQYTATQELQPPASNAIGVPRAVEPKAGIPPAVQPKADTSGAAKKPAAEQVEAKSAAVWLREAREALARGDSQATRNLVSSAESSSPTRAERAEAGTLRAEAAMLDRDRSGALAHYRDVGSRYADLPAGDNAAFAAAQLAARVDPSHERELLESYLTRFPNGRFRDEVKQRIARLAK